MSVPLDPIPEGDVLIDSTSRMTDRWYRWLSALVALILTSPSLVASKRLTSISASVTATTIYTPTRSSLLFRVSWRAGITRAASVSSSITVTLSWTEGGNVKSFSFPAITGNTLGTAGGDSLPIRPDSGKVVTFATTYASVGGVTMSHDLDVLIEEVT